MSKYICAFCGEVDKDHKHGYVDLTPLDELFDKCLELVTKQKELELDLIKKHTELNEMSNKITRIGRRWGIDV